jgi:hypothetical protein
MTVRGAVEGEDIANTSSGKFFCAAGRLVTIAWARANEIPPNTNIMYALALLSIVLVAVAAAVPTQIHISYTQVPGELAVDFVALEEAGYVTFSATAGGPFTTRPSTSFNFSTIGFMHQALMSFNGSAAGFYKVGSAGGESALFAVTPTPARAERFAVLGDFGLRHDECMADLIRGAATGAFDSVVHVGDWAYNFESDASATGNAFMALMQGYAATKCVWRAPRSPQRGGAGGGSTNTHPYLPTLNTQTGDAQLRQPRGMRVLRGCPGAHAVGGQLHAVPRAHARSVPQLQHWQ